MIKPPEGSIIISTPFTTTEVKIADINHQERTALASLLGFTSARKKAFIILRELKKFKKIKPYEVWKTCPKGNRGFSTEVEVSLINGTDEGERMCQKILDILPEAETSAGIHRVSGFCQKCGRIHSVTKRSVLVKLIVEGVPFSNMYEV